MCVCVLVFLCLWVCIFNSGHIRTHLLKCSALRISPGLLEMAVNNSMVFFPKTSCQGIYKGEKGSPINFFLYSYASSIDVASFSVVAYLCNLCSH